MTTRCCESIDSKTCQNFVKESEKASYRFVSKKIRKWEINLKSCQPMRSKKEFRLKLSLEIFVCITFFFHSIMSIIHNSTFFFNYYHNMFNIHKAVLISGTINFSFKWEWQTCVVLYDYDKCYQRYIFKHATVCLFKLRASQLT